MTRCPVSAHSLFACLGRSAPLGARWWARPCARRRASRWRTAGPAARRGGPWLGFLLIAGAWLRWRRVGLCWLAVAVGFGALHVFRRANVPAAALAQRLGDRPRAVWAVGTVADEPRARTGASNARFTLALEHLELDGEPLPGGARVAVSWPLTGLGKEKTAPATRVGRPGGTDRRRAQPARPAEPRRGGFRGAGRPPRGALGDPRRLPSGRDGPGELAGPGRARGTGAGRARFAGAGCRRPWPGAWETTRRPRP